MGGRLPNHVVVRGDAVAAALPERPHASTGVVTLGADYCDDRDVAVVAGTPGRDVLVVAVDEPEAAATAYREARELDPDLRALLVCALLAAEDEIVVFTVDDDKLASVDATVVPRSADVFDRVRGIFQTDVLRDRGVAVLGLGSGGSLITDELARSGVGRFLLVDDDRLDVGNVCRHEAGLSDVGRLKANVMRDLVHDRNVTATVTTRTSRIDGDTLDSLQAAIRGMDIDLVICATDNRPSRLLINRLCLMEELPGLFAGVFRRAYGGLVLRVVPSLTPCYQCFVSALPQMAADHEVSSPDDASRHAYSDRVVPVEPGLSSDIAPIALQVVKLATLELLGDVPTTLDSLRHDLVAPLYLWLNRREPGTDYAALEPMETNIDGLSVLRWYGVDLPRDPACPTCGAAPELSPNGPAEELNIELFGASPPTDR